jgi:hypothetical protein
MTTNRLARSENQPDRIVPPKDKAERQAFWIARGNRVLWGEEPNGKGEYLTPRRDLEWRCVDGSYFIDQRAKPTA